MGDVAQRITDEHRNIAKVLKTLQAVVQRLQGRRDDDDLRCLFDICHYLRVFPDTVHHPKEEAHVFGPLRARAPQHAQLLDEVRDQHAQCDALTEELYAAAKAFDARTLDAAALGAACARYLTFQFAHMRLEETRILPLLEKCLGPDERTRADSAFASHGDPLFGSNLEAGFQALHRRIVGAS